MRVRGTPQSLSRISAVIAVIAIASFLLVEAFWLATFRASSHGLAERRPDMFWWALGEFASLSGVLGCDCFAAFLIDRWFWKRRSTLQTLAGTTETAKSDWIGLFAGLVFSAVATVAVALGAMLL